MDPRQMAMMMKRMGIEMRDIEGVREVVVRTASKEYVFTKAAVSVMKAQGQETWQVVGTPKVRDVTGEGPGADGAGRPVENGPGRPVPGGPGRPVAGGQGTDGTTPSRGPAGAEQGRGSQGGSGAPAAATQGTETAAAMPTFTDDDVRLVMQQAKVDHATARRTLEACNGDLAEAILKLS